MNCVHRMFCCISVLIFITFFCVQDLLDSIVDGRESPGSQAERGEAVY